MALTNSEPNGETLAVGCGAGFSGDRVDAPGPVVRTLVERGGPAVIMFEMLAERTLALAQLARKAESRARLRATARARAAADPRGLHQSPHHDRRQLRRRQSARRGSDDPPARRASSGCASRASRWSKATIYPVRREADRARALPRDFDERRFVCANVYQGAFAIADAIKAGAQVVVTGRVADPSLTLARRSRISAGPRPTGTQWPARRWRAICSNAARR